MKGFPALKVRTLTGLVALSCGAQTERLNLVLVSLDTCRADRLSCYGYGRETSPRLDRFAAEAALFRDCLAQSTATGPSHMSIMTGHFVHRHGLARNADARVPPYTLASLLAEAGWRTGAFTGHGSLQARFGHGLGFEVFESWSQGDPPRNRYTRDLSEVLPGALSWLESVRADPSFLFVHAYDPHCPYWPPQDLREELGGWYRGGLELEELCGHEAFAPLFEGGGPPEEALRYLGDLYDGEIRSADHWFGELLDRLQEQGLLERSIVVFTSDHGEALGEHGWVGHTTQWEQEIRVPLLIRFPGGRWSGPRDEAVQHVDLAPTLLSALGVPAPEGQQGVDLMPVLRGERRLEGERLRLCRTDRLSSARFDRRWKVVWGETKATGGAVASLYDLERDPEELVDLAATPEGLERFRAIRSRIQDWVDATRDLRFRGRALDDAVEDGDLEMLRALGYAGGEAEER